MKFIQNHPFTFTAILGTILGITGFIFSQKDPAEAAMILGASIVILSGACWIGTRTTGD